MSVRTVTVMFTDMVGSTAAMYRLGEAAADGLRREHDVILGGEIESNGGTIVKHLGDGLMVSFDSAVTALGCAVAIQARLSQRPSGAEPLRIRIGVSTGEATQDGADYFGAPVVEAARLCASAEPAEIRLTEMVRLLVGSRGNFDLEPLGELDLKGLPEPITVHRLKWNSTPARIPRSVPIPRRVELLGAGAFTGRRRERDVLDRALREVEAGGCRAVLLTGEPGIGKSTLAARFAVDAVARGAAVAYGRCDADIQAPYKPWVEVVEYLIQHLPDDVIAAHLDECGDHLATLAPALSHALRPTASAMALHPEADRFRLFRSVADLFMRVADLQVTVLLFDDIQWADAESLQLLKYLLGTDQPQRVLVVATLWGASPGLDGSVKDPLASLRRELGVERVDLTGLDDDEMLSLLEELVGHEMDAAGIALRDALAGETDGNPFFFRELLRHLRDTGAIHPDSDDQRAAMADVSSAGLPSSIREVVSQRTRWLGSDTDRMLGTAAVIGRTFDVAVLADILDADESRVVEMCEQAAGADLLHHSESGVARYHFAHGLIERTLYDELPAWQRAQLHRAVAEKIELAGNEPPVEQLAYHWARAAGSDAARRAVDFAHAAGDLALRRLAPTEAQRWYRDALRTLDPAERRSRVGVELGLGLAIAGRALGEPGAQSLLLQSARAAIDLGDRELLVRAAIASARTRFIDVDDSLIEVLRAAIDAVGPDPTPERARLLACLAAELTYAEGPNDRHELAVEAVDIARSVREPRLLIDVGTKCDFALDDHRHAEDHRQLADEVARLAEEVNEPDLAVRAHSNACRAVLRLGDRLSYEWHRFCVITALERLGGWPDWQASGEYAELFGPILDGDPDAVDRAYSAYFDAATKVGNDGIGRIVLSAGLLTSSWMRGSLGALSPMISQTIRDEPQVPVFRCVLAWAHALEESTDLLKPLLAQAGADGFNETSPEFWLFAQALWAEASHAAGDRRCAALLAPRIEEWVDQMALNAGTILCSISYYAGLVRHTLGDLDAAVEHLERALVVHHRLEAPFLVAYTNNALAAVLAERAATDDLRRVIDLATAALTTAERFGYGYVRRDAERLLRRESPGFTRR